MAGKSIRFLGTDVLLQVCIWNRCSEKKRDRTYRAHLRCLPSAVLRTSFKERVIGWDQSRKENGESTGLRLKTHESCHNWAGAHQSVHMDLILCTSVLILWNVCFHGRKTGPEKYGYFNFFNASKYPTRVSYIGQEAKNVFIDCAEKRLVIGLSIFSNPYLRLCEIKMS